MPNQTDQVVIYDRNSGTYWAENACGYTTGYYAGVYSREEAIRLTKSIGPEKPTSLEPVPSDHVPTLKARIAELEAQLEQAKCK